MLPFSLLLAVPLFPRVLLGIGDESEDHPVQVVEEADQIEAQLNEADLLMLAQRPEDFGGVQGVILVHDFVDVERHERSVEKERYPLTA